MSLQLVDLHTHVLPGVDDGARDLDEATEALRALVAQGVSTVAATPHVRASRLEGAGRGKDRLAYLDAAAALLREAIAASEIDIELARGVELKLDAPVLELSDERLRLGGSRYVLVEFSTFQIPPFAGNQLRAVVDAGYTPVLAHPERYLGTGESLARLERWREQGTLFQVNGGSLVGRYGQVPEAAARALLARGWIDLLASDFHSRGVPDLLEVRDRLLLVDGGEEAATLLLRENPGRLLLDEEPRAVAPLEAAEPGRRAGLRRWFR